MMGAVWIFPFRPCPLAFSFTYGKCWLQMWKGKVDGPRKKYLSHLLGWCDLVQGYTGSLRARKMKRIQWGLHSTWCWESRTGLWSGDSARCQKGSPGRQSGSGGAGFTRLSTARSIELFSSESYLYFLLADVSCLPLEVLSWLSSSALIRWCCSASRHDKACESHYPKCLASAWIIVLLPCFTIPSCFAVSGGLLSLWPAHSTLKTSEVQM